MPADPESSWRLLFDIALSHGESIRLQRLTYAGLYVFLFSAELLGPKTGVFPLLIDRLWYEHSRPLRPADEAVLFGDVSEASVADGGDSSGAARVRYAVGLVGFTDIMNVVSVRCFQTNKLATLYNEKDGAERGDLKRAIALSAEDRVRLEESVVYTAGEYLRPFIFASTLHPTTVITTDPARERWATHAGRLVRYLVESLRASVVVPLFRVYSGNYSSEGEIGSNNGGALGMDRHAYARFVQEVFPSFTAVHRAGALAIFDYEGLADTGALLARSRVQFSTAMSPPRRLLGVDAFVDALLMLSIVRFADERQHPHHRPITAKIWSTFEEHYCPAAARVASVMARPVLLRDPLFAPPSLQNPTVSSSPSAAATTAMVAVASVEGMLRVSVTPTLSLVYPEPFPMALTSSLLLGGLSVRVDPTACLSVAEADALAAPGGPRDGLPPRLLSDTLAATAAAPQTMRQCTGSYEASEKISDIASAADSSSAGSDRAPADSTFLTGIAAAAATAPTVSASIAPANPTANAKDPVQPPGRARQRGLVAAQAAALFTRPLGKPMVAVPPRSRVSPGDAGAATDLSHAPMCSVFIDEDSVPCICRGPSQVEALLPAALWTHSARHMRLRVSVHDGPTSISNSGGSSDSDEGIVVVHYTPCRIVLVSLRDAAGETVFAERSVKLTLEPRAQVLPIDLVGALRQCYASAAAANDSDARSNDDDNNGGETIGLAALKAAVVRTGLVRPAAADTTVADAITLTETSASCGATKAFRFADFIAVVAALPCTSALGGSADTVPRLVDLLRVALAQSSIVASSLSAPVASPPHSGRLDVPFRAACQRRAVANSEGTGDRDALFEALREAHKQARVGAASSAAHGSSVTAAAASWSLLPGFPAHLTPNPLFTSLLVDEGCGSPAAAERQAVAALLQEAFLQSSLAQRPSLTNASSPV